MTFFNALGNSSLSNKVISLVLDRLEERDPANAVVATTAGDTAPAVIATGNISSAANPVIPWASITRTFANGATLEFVYYIYANPENVTFGNTVVVLYSGSLKFTVDVTDWPFQDVNNTLWVWSIGSFYNIVPDPTKVLKDSRGSVYQLTIGPQYPSAPPFVVNLPQIVLADDVVQPTYVDLDAINILPAVIAVKFFFPSGNHIFYDPDVSVLFEPADEDGGNSGGGDGGDGTTTLAIAIAVPVGVTVACLVVMAVIVVGVVIGIWQRKAVVSRIRLATNEL